MLNSDWYQPFLKELAAFGDHWCGPEVFPDDQEWHLVARYVTDPRSYGQDVEVYRLAMPASFYQIKALPGSDSTGDPIPPWVFRTGSSMWQLAVDMAGAASDGMLRDRTCRNEPSRRAVLDASTDAIVLQSVCRIANQLSLKSVAGFDYATPDAAERLTVCESLVMDLYHLMLGRNFYVQPREESESGCKQSQ